MSFFLHSRTSHTLEQVAKAINILKSFISDYLLVTITLDHYFAPTRLPKVLPFWDNHMHRP